MPMVGRMRKGPQQFRKLYIGEWISALGYRPVDVVEGTDLDKGYLSQLISGKKKNPSGRTLLDISTFLDIPLDYLYRPPPPKSILEETAGISAAVLARLRTGVRPDQE